MTRLCSCLLFEHMKVLKHVYLARLDDFSFLLFNAFFGVDSNKVPGLYLCCDYIKSYSWPVGFLYFHRPINTGAITLKTYLTDYLNQSQNFTIGRSSADNRAIIGQQSADRRPIAF